MNTWLRRRRSGNREGAFPRSRTFRPQLEVLEDRCVLSGYVVTNLASDIPGLAPVTDPNLVNPWGISFSPTGAFWFSENGTGVSDLLNGDGSVQPLVVRIPGANGAPGTPTGTVYQGGRGFKVSENGLSDPSLFLFATEDGTISGWDPYVDPTHAILAVDNSSSGAVYKGLALATDPSGNTYLYAANFHSGSIDVFNVNFKQVSWAGAFQDPSIPAGYAPFNIQDINGLLYVTYAQQDQARHDNVPGAGSGFIDVYTPDGGLVRRLVSGGPLNSPWGLALAPANFGSFSGDLLVGNTGDGRINAFDPTTGAYQGPLTDSTGAPIVIPNLWGLAFGNGHMAAPANELFFTAGIGGEQHGLFGAIRDPSVAVESATTPVEYNPNNLDDEYPLPPDNGPALASFAAARADPTTVFLGAGNSPLLLAPTLTTAPQFAGQPTFALGSQPGAAAPGGPGTSSPAGVWLLPSANTSAVSPLVVGPLAAGNVERTGLVSLGGLLDVNAPKPGGDGAESPNADSFVSPAAAPSLAASSEGPASAPGVEEETAALLPEGHFAGQPEKPPSPAPTVLVESRADPVTEEPEPSGSFLHHLLLGKLLLLSTAAVVWYYLPAGKPGQNEGGRPPTR